MSYEKIIRENLTSFNSSEELITIPKALLDNILNRVEFKDPFKNRAEMADHLCNYLHDSIMRNEESIIDSISDLHFYVMLDLTVYQLCEHSKTISK